MNKLKKEVILERIPEKYSQELFEKRIEYNASKTDKNFENFLKAVYREKYENNILTFVKTGGSYSFLKEKSTIVFYGAGELATHFAADCELKKRPNTYFCDKNYDEIKEVLGVKVVSPQEAFNKYKNAYFCITTYDYYNEIIDILLENNIELEQILVIPKDFLNAEGMYLDPILNFTEDEIFVDAGVLDAKSSILFAKHVNFKYEKIYLFEPDLDSYNQSKENLMKENIKNANIMPIGLWDKEEKIYFSSIPSGASHIDESGDIEINVNSLDNILNGEKVTYIKMDIEGSELKALIGAKETIRKYKPKLAISVYHKTEDIIEIPAFISELVPEYKLYLRHYTYTPSETVLYAII